MRYFGMCTNSKLAESNIKLVATTRQHADCRLTEQHMPSDQSDNIVISNDQVGC